MKAVRGEYAVGYAMTTAEDKGAVSVLWNLDRGTVTKMSYEVNNTHDVNSPGVTAVSTRGDGGDAAVVELARNADGDAHAVVWRGCAS